MHHCNLCLFVGGRRDLGLHHKEFRSANGFGSAPNRTDLSIVTGFRLRNQPPKHRHPQATPSRTAIPPTCCIPEARDTASSVNFLWHRSASLSDCGSPLRSAPIVLSQPLVYFLYVSGFGSCIYLHSRFRVALTPSLHVWHLMRLKSSRGS